MLNLDVEEEDTERECLLCKNANHSYLDEMHSALSPSSSRKNLYDMLYDAYIKQKNKLKQQNLRYLDVTRIDLVRHYEEHVLSLQNAIMNDVRLVKQVMKQLEKKMLGDKLNTAALNQWKVLSNHKINLLKSMAPVESIESNIDQSYKFS
tara:strand:- start:65 stop:514 length:450 start_codon:yes stop_codon:yes gene_type:complete